MGRARRPLARPFFRTRRLQETILADSREVKWLPTVALAEYADGQLVHVAPSRSTDRVVDVVSRLEAIATLGSGSPLNG